MNNHFSIKNVCQILYKQKLLDKNQIKRVFEKEDLVLKKLNTLEEQQSKSFLSNTTIAKSITIVDVIVYLKLKRKDRPEWVLDEEMIYKALSKAWNYEFKKIDPLKLDLHIVTSTIPKNFALRHLVLPIAIDDDRVTLATSDPFNTEVFDDVVRVTRKKIKKIVSTKSDIIKSLNEYFGFKKSIAAAEDVFSLPTIDLGNLEQYVKLSSGADLPHTDQHIVSAVNHLFVYAFDQKASDVHVEPKRESSLVRMRIDGVLHTVFKLPKKVHNAFVTRIKALARLDMAEKRRPQDGRIKTDKDGVEVEIRISTIPVAFGEKIVMRIMDPDILLQDLKGLGFSTHDLEKFKKTVSMPHGMILVCGPTGSGKSTTLYSTLMDLASPEINVTTIEDPIEMIHEDFNQISVMPKIDITFGSVLRNILRQDPDVIMVGEMRDLETAESAVQAALTGHLVLSTLHTNDAPSAITRLIDLGIPYYMLQSTVIGVLAQRLVREICQYCKEPLVMETSELRSLGLEIGRDGTINLSQGKGCQKCRGTGYKGRIGIFELMPFTDTLKTMTTSEVDVMKLRSEAIKDGMVTLRQNAIKKMLDGVTTYQEVLKITWDQM